MKHIRLMRYAGKAVILLLAVTGLGDPGGSIRSEKGKALPAAEVRISSYYSPNDIFIRLIEESGPTLDSIYFTLPVDLNSVVEALTESGWMKRAKSSESQIPPPPERPSPVAPRLQIVLVRGEKILFTDMEPGPETSRYLRAIQNGLSSPASRRNFSEMLKDYLSSEAIPVS